MEFKCKKCGKCCSQFDNISGGIVIFEWEKDRLEQVSLEINTDFKIEHGQVDYDSKSNTKIISTYAFKSKSCPFLKNNQCSIHSKRPIYCKAYPLLVNLSKEKSKLGFLDCPNIILPKENNLKEYYKIYGDIFLSALEIELFRNKCLDLIKKLKENNLIKLRKEKANDNPKIETLFKFLVNNKLLLQEDIDKIIKDFLNLKNAKNLIGLR